MEGMEGGRKHQRVLANRHSARKSRQKKLQQIQDFEAINKQLERNLNDIMPQVQELRDRLREMVSVNTSLQDHLQYLQSSLAEDRQSRSTSSRGHMEKWLGGARGPGGGETLRGWNGSGSGSGSGGYAGEAGQSVYDGEGYYLQAAQQFGERRRLQLRHEGAEGYAGISAQPLGSAPDMMVMTANHAPESPSLVDQTAAQLNVMPRGGPRAMMSPQHSAHGGAGLRHKAQGKAGFDAGELDGMGVSQQQYGYEGQPYGAGKGGSHKPMHALLGLNEFPTLSEEMVPDFSMGSPIAHTAANPSLPHFLDGLQMHG